MNAGTMEAVVHDRYGRPEVLRVEVVERPVPKADEVMVKVRATTVNRTDCHVRAAKPFLWRFFGAGLLRPKQRRSGSDFAGEVVAVGDAVTTFVTGDHVFGTSGYRFGAHAEFLCVRESGLIAHKPAGMTFEEAAAIADGALAALRTLRRIDLRKGQSIVVYGASGAMGTAAVQLAKHFGANVTGVCSTANLELVRSLGATHVIDYTQEDFTQNGETYDIIVDTVGTAPFSRCKNSFKDGGRLLLVLATLPDMLLIPWASMTSSKKIIAGPAAERAEDLRFLAKLAAAGEFKPVIDRRFPFEQIVAAHHYVDSGRKKGNVVITLEHDD